MFNAWDIKGNDVNVYKLRIYANERKEYSTVDIEKNTEEWNRNVHVHCTVEESQTKDVYKDLDAGASALDAKSARERVDVVFGGRIDSH